MKQLVKKEVTVTYDCNQKRKVSKKTVYEYQYNNCCLFEEPKKNETSKITD